MLKIAVHVTTWFIIHQNWIFSSCFMIWLTEVNAFCHPPEAFESKSISNHNKVIRLWCKVIANDCCACVVSAASTLCTLAVYHFQNYLEQSLTAYIWTYILYPKTATKFVDRVEQKVTTNPKLGQDRKSRSLKKRRHL